MRHVDVDSFVQQKMYGIAVTMDPDVFDTLTGSLLVYRGVHMIPRPSSVFPGTIIPYMYDTTVDSIYSMPFSAPPLMKQCVFEYDYSLPTVSSLYSNCYEFYFDEPIILSTNPDSNIYIGITKCGFNSYKLNLGRDTSRSQEWFEVGKSIGGSGPEPDMITFKGYMNYYSLPIGGGKYKPYYELDGYSDYYWGDSYWGMIFPILHPRCTAPKCVAYVGDKIEWCGDPESEVFQVSLTAYPASADSGMVSTVKDNGFQLPDDLPEPACVAYVRKMCTFEFESHTDTVWGDWAGPVLVVGDTTGLGGEPGGDTVGIATVKHPGISLTPNPTSGKVTVGCNTGIRQVTVFNAAGKLVHTSDATSKTMTTIDTQGWPAGQYVVTVETAAGTVSKVLTVAR